VRILFVLAHFHPYIGGAEHLFRRLAEGLVLRGHSASVITSRLPETLPFENSGGVEIKRVWTPRFLSNYLFSVFALPKVINQASNYDLIHTASNYSALPAFLAAKLSGIPTVFTCNEVLGQRWHWVKPNRVEGSFFQTLEKLVIRLPYDKYVAISQATHLDLLEVGIDPSRAEVVYCGIDEAFAHGSRAASGELRALCGIGPTDFLYVYFGRPGITKGIEYLLKAVPAIQRQVPDSHLALILGREPRGRYLHLRRLTNELGCGANVHFIPSVPDREQLIRYQMDADCVVIPSLTEGFGLAVAETCALGIPVVATRAGSIPEVVSGRYILVAPASAEEISEGVVRAWRGQYDEEGEPKQFSWTRMVTEYEQVYNSVLKNKARLDAG